MNQVSFYTTPAELKGIRTQLAEYDWYARSFANLRKPADELLRHGISIPKEKGFVFYDTCPGDNSPLRQDPFNPRDRCCPSCGRNYTDEPYYRAWVSFYQIYVAQRAVEMGIAYQVTGDDSYATAIRHILMEYARSYRDYPVEGFVLGPTRLFQSTFIESLWLASLAAAADFVRDVIPDAEWRRVRGDLLLPSADLIRSFDEGDNNRQAMNNVAIGLVGLLCDESALVDLAVHGQHGWLHHLEHSVLDDGMWYEGDNYHFATLPAMLNLAEAMSRHGQDLWSVEAGGHKLAMMFDAPLLNLYPDQTMPARKDSRYGSPIGQRWYAGMYELAFRRCSEPAYGVLLRGIYSDPPDEHACVSNAAGFIDVLPSTPANRERLDWRGFLAAVPTLDQTPGGPVTTSVNLSGTGLGILRADAGRTYLSVDYGRYGGGHGHPDRLQLNLYARGRRWLTDWGTGNYLFDHLRWYRSTVGHNTVVIDGLDQRAADGRLRRFENGNAGCAAIVAEADDAYPGVRYRRASVLLTADLVLDLFTIEADRERCLDWVIHPVADRAFELDGTSPLAPAALTGDHYEWLHDAHRADTTGGWAARFTQGSDTLAVHGIGHAGTEILTAAAYGPPDQIPGLFPVLIIRRRARTTTFVTLFEHRTRGVPVVDGFAAEPAGHYSVLLRGGGRLVCRFDEVEATATITRSARTDEEEAASDA